MKYTWLVEKYLEGELRGKELADFELMILRDREVANEVERVRSLLEFSREQHKKLIIDIELIEEFDDADNILDEQELDLDLDNLKIRKVADSDAHEDISRKIRELVRRDSSSGMKHLKLASMLKINLWLTAASIALLITLGIVLLNLLTVKTDHLALYNQYFRPYNMPEEESRDAMQEESNAFQKGLDEYKLANYSSALEYFNTSISEDPDYTYSYLFRACALMELGEYREALVSLKELERDRTLDDYGVWYSGLCYLMLDNRDQSELLLRQLVKQKSYLAPQARSLLKKL